jgi:hypothetical protein
MRADKKVAPAPSNFSTRIGHGPAYTMKDMKRTYVPVPGSKSKPKAKDTPSKVQLSQEFIGSDSDSPAETAPKPKPKTTIAVHRPTAAAKSKEKPSKKDAAAPTPQPKVKPAPKKPAPATVVTQAQADELSTSEQTDDDHVPTRDIQTKLAERDVSASGSDDGSSDDSSSDESVSNEAPQPAQAYVMLPCPRHVPTDMLQASAIIANAATQRRVPPSAGVRAT